MSTTDDHGTSPIRDAAGTGGTSDGSIGGRMADIRLVRADGSATSLHATVAGAPAVVYFMRTSTCPVCHGHLRALTRLTESGALGGMRVVVVVPGGAAEAAEVVRRAPSSALEVLASLDGHAQVGLGVFLALQHSGTFLLDADGVVTYRRSGAVPLMSFDERELLDRLGGAGR